MNTTVTEEAAAEGAEAKVETPPPPQESEADRRAKRLGWVPKEEFRGDPEHWRNAEQFLEWSDAAAPSLRRDNDRLHKRLTEVEGLLKDAKDTLGEFREFASKAEQRAYERAKAEIQKRIEKGAADADAGAVRAGMAELDQLNKDAPKPAERKPERQEPKINQTIQDWIDREQWFVRDSELKEYAGAIFNFLEKTKPGMSLEDMLAETKRRTKNEFPEKFGNPMRNGAAAVSEPSGGNSPPKKGKTYNDLPPYDRKACDGQVKRFGITREEWLKHYDWDA